MVEGTALEKRHTGNGIESSNLSLSAKRKRSHLVWFRFRFYDGRDEKFMPRRGKSLSFRPMKKAVQFSFSGKVWRYPGTGGWHFVTLSEKVSVQIRKAVQELRPWGYVKVKATIGKTSWQTGLWPQAKEKRYLLVLKKEVRKKEGIVEGSTVRGTIIIL